MIGVDGSLPCGHRDAWSPGHAAQCLGAAEPRVLGHDNRDHAPFQVMPRLAVGEYLALLEDIRQRGVLVPAVVDQHGRILDGHHRIAACQELGIDCPTVVREVADDDEAHGLALTLNLARRHLTREQRRDLIAAELRRRPEDSDRAVARRVGASPTTVGSVRVQLGQQERDAERRREQIEEAEARQRLEEVRQTIHDYHGWLAAVLVSEWRETPRRHQTWKGLVYSLFGDQKNQLRADTMTGKLSEEAALCWYENVLHPWLKDALATDPPERAA